jgi:hypothetical protein
MNQPNYGKRHSGGWLRYQYLLTLACLLSACSYLGDPFLPRDARNRMHVTAEYIHIRSATGNPATKGLMFYPGGLVDPHAYLEWLDQLVTAQPDLQVVLVKAPANLAVFSPQRGKRLLGEFPEVRQWMVAGHSLGGTMACRLVNTNRNDFAAIILLAAYPTDSDNLSDWGGTVLSITGSADGLVSPDDISRRADLLPPSFPMTRPDDFPAELTNRTLYFQIAGANHAQFGSYGPQKGDNPAGISRPQQHSAMIELISNFTRELL